jgi:hypothetical protein
MRLYFDLGDGRRTIPDVDGVEVPNLDGARRIVLDAIRELREEDPSITWDWSGWRLSVVDSAGTVVLTIDLDGAAA